MDTQPSRPADRGRNAAKAFMRLCNRHPMLYITTLIAALIGHSFLCYPAAVSRGHPPINPFWEYIAICVAFLAPAIAPFFEDFAGTSRIRKSILSTCTAVASIIAAVPLANMASARPRTGHLAGYFGVWQYHSRMILIETVVTALAAIPFVICLESIARTARAIVRKLPAINGRIAPLD